MMKIFRSPLLIAPTLLLLAACASSEPTPSAPVGRNQAALNEFNTYIEKPRTDFLRCALTTAQGVIKKTAKAHNAENIATASVAACAAELRSFETAIAGMAARHGADAAGIDQVSKAKGAELSEEARLAVIRYVTDARRKAK